MAQGEEENKKAVIRAKAVKYNSGNRTLYICNDGKAIAKNLKVEMPDAEHVFASKRFFLSSLRSYCPEQVGKSCCS